MSHTPLQHQSKEHSSEKSEQSPGLSMSPPAFQLHASSINSGGDNNENLQGKKRPAGEAGNGELLARKKLNGEKEGESGGFLDSIYNTVADAAGSLYNSVSEWWNSAGEEKEKESEESDKEKLKLTHETLDDAPDGSGKQRTNVGVGEIVTFKCNKAGTWKASGGEPTSQDTMEEFVWIAPKRATTATISVTVGDKTETISLNVLEPASITADKNGEKSFSKGDAGAGMYLTFNYHPYSVSFSGVEAREVSGPGTNVKGYFKDNFTDKDRWHDSGDTFTQVGIGNKDTAQDEAAGGPLPKPWSEGSLDWVIPNFFRIVGESGDGKKIQDVTQSFRTKEDGTLTVTKLGQKVERSPNS